MNVFEEMNKEYSEEEALAIENYYARKKEWGYLHGDKDRYEDYHKNAEYEAINCATGEIKPAIEE